jgi:exonuclease SbcD
VADLHIGKIVNDFSMLEDQKFILSQIKELAVKHQVEGILIAGDIYDRAIPPAEAVAVFDNFVTGLSEQGILVFMVSGNHDSPERIGFGEELFSRAGVYIAGVLKEELKVGKIKQDYGQLQVLLLPFVKPGQVGARITEEAVEKLLARYWEKESEEEAKRKAQKEKEAEVRRILVTHYFVTDGEKEPELSDSESTVHVGGLDNVDVSLFEGFDYVALGHIHKPQRIGMHPVWYAGAPLKYSFGETMQTKQALLVDINEKGLQRVEQVALYPFREMRKLKGTLQELMENTAYRECYGEDYIQAILTDKGELIDAIGTLRSAYPNIMQIVREDALQVKSGEYTETAGRRNLAEAKDTRALFAAFYREVRGEELGEEGHQIIAELIKEMEA